MLIAQNGYPRLCFASAIRAVGSVTILPGVRKSFRTRFLSLQALIFKPIPIVTSKYIRSVLRLVTLQNSNSGELLLSVVMKLDTLELITRLNNSFSLALRQRKHISEPANVFAR